MPLCYYPWFKDFFQSIDLLCCFIGDFSHLAERTFSNWIVELKLIRIYTNCRVIIASFQTAVSHFEAYQIFINVVLITRIYGWRQN
ncbi:unnamed protein product [Blepharisma stoltei]|uniref:Uncharacterized protein n=1 Tax=Blepharisma stoltei TaxID=1481888 RepID=A0AAU9JPP9_9CILI|nr:unnamed protein product [Blepharisma stoltei]